MPTDLAPFVELQRPQMQMLATIAEPPNAFGGGREEGAMQMSLQ